ncbi:MAG: alpha-amylase family protein [Tannerella sp.]|jgi:glycosidase|nr:alpha-amylase family protein [Tannerella sp.]
MKTNKHIIYQTFPRLFGNYGENPVKNGSIEENGCGKFNSYTAKALESIRELGVTHIWYTGIIAHSTCTDYTAYGIPKDHHAIVKGNAGSPYAVRDYYDVDPDLAENVPNRMNEFKALVKRTHDAGMKVIIDFVPNHVARSYRSLMKPAYVDDLGQHDRTELAFSAVNNFYYIPGHSLELHFGAQEEDFEYSEFPAKVTGNDCFSATPGRNDWYETIKLNYGVDYLNGGTKYFSPTPGTWHKMLDILLFWAGNDIDGFRCDMAEMVPVEFWSWAIPRVKSRKNVMFIAEVYNPGLYRTFIETGKFDYLYDKAGMYDTLRKIICREAPCTDITACWQAIEPVKEHMLFFIENHDEQRIASDFFAGNAQAGIPGLALIALLDVNPVMIYNGQELGEKGMDDEGFSGMDGRTSIFDYWSMKSVRDWADSGRFDGGKLDDEQRRLRESYKTILTPAKNEKALSHGRFYGLAYCNRDNPAFPSEQMSAFLRKYENELILVFINFDSKTHHFRANIPENAFDVLNIPDNIASKARDLISGEETICALTHACPYRESLPACSVKILKISY